MAKIIGNVTATPNPRPDWNQMDKTKADYIKNKPIECNINNTAVKAKCFMPTSEFVDTTMATYTITLDSVEGLVVGDNLIKAMYEDGVFTGWQSRNIEAIDTEENLVHLGSYFYYRPDYSVSYEPKIKNGIVFAECAVNLETGEPIGSTDVIFDDDDPQYFHLEGNNNIGVLGAVVEGSFNIGASISSHVEGSYNIASGHESHAEGEGCEASGKRSHAEGSGSIASGIVSHAEGSASEASGLTSHAEGHHTKAEGWASHSEGFQTVARGEHQHVEGVYNIIDENNEFIHIAGNGHKSIGTRSNAHTLDWSGNAWYAGDVTDGKGNMLSKKAGKILDNNAEIFNDYTGNIATARAAHAEGVKTQATGIESHAEGRETKASGIRSHSEGYMTEASGAYAHAEGYNTDATAEGAHAEGRDAQATGAHSHAEGYSTLASNNTAHAEGINCEATGNATHAEGRFTKAIGMRSHSEGEGTIAGGAWQHVEGKYNIPDYDYGLGTGGKYVHIVGNGIGEDTYDEEGNLIQNRSNAYTLDWSGNGWFSGEVYVGEDNYQLAHKQTKAGGFIAGNVVNFDGEEFNEDTFEGVAIGNQICVYNNIINGVGIGKGATVYSDGVAIGDEAHSEDNGCIAIGHKVTGWMGYSIGIGQEAFADWKCIAIGYKALADINNIQLGTGHNTEAGTFQVYDYQLLDADGNIPKERLNLALGDIETALENIIAKYGLGGDAA